MNHNHLHHYVDDLKYHQIRLFDGQRNNATSQNKWMYHGVDAGQNNQPGKQQLLLQIDIKLLFF
jgi:hypothetical protein